MTQILIVTSAIIAAPYIIYRIAKSMEKKRFKRLLFANLLAFSSVMGYTIVFMFTNVYANQPQAITANERGMAFLAAALVTGMCTIGTGIATGQAASAALGAISENEGLMGKALIFVALAEGIAIYGLLISFTILARV